MAKRSVLGLLYLLQGLQAAGEDMQAILHELAIDLHQLDPSAVIDVELEYAIQKQIVQHIRHPAIGLYIGQQFNLAGYGQLLMLLLTSKTLLEAINLGIHYQKLTFLFGHLSLQQDEQTTVLIYDSLEHDVALHRFRADTEIAGTFKLLKDIQTAMATQIPFDRVDLPFSAPADARLMAQYQQFYGLAVYFDQPRGAIYCKTSHLNHAISAADPITHQRYRQQCDESLQQYLQEERQAVSIQQQVMGYLKLQAHFLPPIAAVAHALGMSERTLRYRLAEQQTNFRTLRDQLRFEQACELLLNSQDSIEQIAEKLHYNEGSAFAHAFVRWSGQSPNQYRSQYRKQDRLKACIENGLKKGLKSRLG